MIQTTEKLNEGKTKIIFGTHYNNLVVLKSKDDVTAGDGQKHDIIPGKGILANKTAGYIFSFLEKNGIFTHYFGLHQPDSFAALVCQMIPLEVVTRRKASGSILKREPALKEGDVFDPLRVEFYFKDDKFHDPLLATDPRQEPSNKWVLVDSKNPQKQVAEIEPLLSAKEFDKIYNRTIEVFTLLEKEFFLANLTLWDLKVEFGRLVDNLVELDASGLIVLADVIDADSWRLTNKNNRQLSKQIYRDGASLEETKKMYEEVEAICRQLFFE